MNWLEMAHCFLLLLIVLMPFSFSCELGGAREFVSCVLIGVECSGQCNLQPYHNELMQLCVIVCKGIR